MTRDTIRAEESTRSQEEIINIVESRPVSVGDSVSHPFGYLPLQLTELPSSPSCISLDSQFSADCRFVDSLLAARLSRT